jgi:hypothetical protein
LLTRYAFPIGFVVLASLGIGALYIRQNPPVGCNSGPTMDRVSAVLRDTFHLDGILVNDVKTVSGWYFSERHDCTAEVAQILGNVEASGMKWRAIRYRILEQDEAGQPVVSVELGDTVPLSRKPPTAWKRVLAFFHIITI